MKAVIFYPYDQLEGCPQNNAPTWEHVVFLGPHGGDYRMYTATAVLLTLCGRKSTLCFNKHPNISKGQCSGAYFSVWTDTRCGCVRWTVSKYPEEAEKQRHS